jgi:hypothetical protein
MYIGNINHYYNTSALKYLKSNFTLKIINVEKVEDKELGTIIKPINFTIKKVRAKDFIASVEDIRRNGQERIFYVVNGEPGGTINLSGIYIRRTGDKVWIYNLVK